MKNNKKSFLTISILLFGLTTLSSCTEREEQRETLDRREMRDLQPDGLKPMDQGLENEDINDIRNPQ